MSACESCLHYNICMERRGACSEYVTLETIRRQIIELNDANQKTASARSEADTARVRQGGAGAQSKAFGSAECKTASRPKSEKEGTWNVGRGGVGRKQAEKGGRTATADR